MRNNPYFNRHLLEVIVSPINQVPQTEDGTVRIFVFFVGTTFQIAVVAGFQDVGPLKKKKVTALHLREAIQHVNH